MKRFAVYSLIGLSFGLLACNNDLPIELSLSQDSVPADGRDIISLEAVVMQGGNPVKDGTKVRFAIDDPEAGTFTKGKDVLYLDGKTVAGVATVEFYPGTTPKEEVWITASTTINKLNQSDRKMLTITSPTPVSAAYFSFSCNYQNVGAYSDVANQVNEIRVPCEVIAKDRNGVDLPNAKINFKAEAGEVKEIKATSKAPRSFYYTYKPGSLNPANVAPSESEKELGLVSEACATNEKSADCKNPRDRLVTIVAYTYGEEACEGEVKDGKCTGKFTEEGEPFLDIDDDGEFKEEQWPQDPSQKWFADDNGNGICDGLNGNWDSGITIGRFTRILLTGDPEFVITPTKLSMCACEQKEFRVTALDEYFNAPATCLNTDKVTITPISFKKSVTTGDNGALDLKNSHYFKFGPETGFHDILLSGKFIEIVTDKDKKLTGREWISTVTDTQEGCNLNKDGTADYSDCTADEEGKATTCQAINSDKVDEFTIKYVYTPIPKVSGVSGTKTETKNQTLLNGNTIQAYNKCSTNSGSSN